MKAAYTYFESPGSVKNDDRNAVYGPKSLFPRRFYKAEPFNSSRDYPGTAIKICQGNPCDDKIDYMYPTQRSQHPDMFSRFGYPWCENGYCIGNHPGRYNTPPAFQWQSNLQPPDMAPQRFYEGRFADYNYSSSDAYNGSAYVRGGTP
jgi:hypothetical protein